MLYTLLYACNYQLWEAYMALKENINVRLDREQLAKLRKLMARFRMDNMSDTVRFLIDRARTK